MLAVADVLRQNETTGLLLPLKTLDPYENVRNSLFLDDAKPRYLPSSVILLSSTVATAAIPANMTL